MTEPRTLVCAYGPCPVEFVPTKPWQRHCSQRCRNRAYVVRRDGGAADPAHASCDASGGEIVRGPGGPQLSYGPAVSMVLPLVKGDREVAERIVRAHLPARQRERLEGKRG